MIYRFRDTADVHSTTSLPADELRAALREELVRVGEYDLVYLTEEGIRVWKEQRKHLPI